MPVDPLSLLGNTTSVLLDIQTVFMSADDLHNYFILTELRFISVGFTFTKPVRIANTCVILRPGLYTYFRTPLRFPSSY